MTHLYIFSKKLLTISLMLILAISCSKPIRIVCIGDSISQGKVAGDTIKELSYRLWLWQKLDSAGIKTDFVGSNSIWFNENRDNLVATPVSNYTKHTFDRNHEAFYGIRTDNFLSGFTHDSVKYEPFEKRVTSYKADIALIHIGTNDKDSLVEQTRENITAIIDLLRGQNPEIKVLLAQTNTGWKAVNKVVPAIVATLNTPQSPVFMVDMATGFINKPDSVGTMTFDWVHPNVKGQQFMAKRWFTTLYPLVK